MKMGDLIAELTIWAINDASIFPLTLGDSAYLPVLWLMKPFTAHLGH